MSVPSLATTVGGVPLSTCVYNASGPRSGTSAALSRVASSSSGAVLAKSATPSAQSGNPQPRTWHDECGSASLNSEGLPNNGIAYYVAESTRWEALGNTDKPYFVSISGSTLEDNLLMLDTVAEAIRGRKDGDGGGEGDDGGGRVVAPPPPIRGVELNLACPNVVGKPIVAYDFDQMEAVLRAVVDHELFSSGSGDDVVVLGVKLPPYFDDPHFARAADLINGHAGTVRYVACVNTVGNALSVDVESEMPSVRSNGGFAGLSGPAVRLTALANVRSMRRLLRDDIDVVGVGGVVTGEDAFRMILCGANAVQVGTCHWTEGPGCFDRICHELQAIMRTKGYDKVTDFCGNLKDWTKEGAALSRAARAKVKKTKGGDTGNATMTVTSSSPANRERKLELIIVALIGVIVLLLSDKVAS